MVPDADPGADSGAARAPDTPPLARVMEDAARGSAPALEHLRTHVYNELRAVARRQLAQERPDHTLRPTELVHEAYLRLAGAAGKAGAANKAGADGVAANASTADGATSDGPTSDGPTADGAAGRAQFFYAAAQAMRRILIEHARSRARVKRGGGRQRVPLDVLDLATCDPEHVIALDEAMERLSQSDPRAADVVRLRFYAGLSIEEAAKVLNLSERTVRREWEYARAYLYRSLE